jgi:hypothetical protein
MFAFGEMDWDNGKSGGICQKSGNQTPIIRAQNPCPPHVPGMPPEDWHEECNERLEGRGFSSRSGG